MFIFIETPAGQNWLAKQVTKRFSKKLKTSISFQHISFSLLDKVNLEGFLVKDQKNDTLLYAGKLQLNFTDWFIFKDSAQIKYVGLENAVVRLQRKDSVWNYQFIADYFAPDPHDTSSSSGMSFDFKNISLRNVVFVQKDGWIGQDLIASVGKLDLAANQINPGKKILDVPNIYLEHPSLNIYNYNGNQGGSEKVDTTVLTSTAVAIDSLLQWNTDNWAVTIGSLRIADGALKNMRQTKEPITSSFDPDDVEFSYINGIFKDLKMHNDTISTTIENLSTKERSGFKLQSLTTKAKINPHGMYFEDLTLKTEKSTIKNYLAMTYNDMSDMDFFLHKVVLHADFDSSEINSDDFAYFSPDLSSWKKVITISGKVRGTISELSAHDLVINAGNSTYINGDVTLSGLPDINQTFVDFKSNDTRTNYRDVVKFVPSIRNISSPNLAALGNIHFKGSFTGFLHDFVTFGLIQTNLGTIRSDLNMKLPEGKEPLYSGNIATSDFQLGRFINSPQLGVISFSGEVKGHGSDINTMGADLKASVTEFEFNGYHYHNITANGTMEKELFNGFATIDDSNLKATFNGLIHLNGPDSRLNLVADVQNADLNALQLTPDKLSFNGKFNLDFTGNNIDNFLGTARITNANLIRNNQRLSFDSLILRSDYANENRMLSINSNEFDGTVTGDFHIEDLPNAIQLFLNKYYPAYIEAPREVITHQNFKFNLLTRNVDPFIQVLDSNLKGFNNSHIEGSLDLAQNQLQLSAVIPQFSYAKQFNFDNVNIKAVGTFGHLTLGGSVQNVTINDSINLPNTSFEILAKNDSSNINISTAANQAVTKADLRATVITYNDGIKVNFDTSSFVLNTKTWTIDKGGALGFRQHNAASGEVVLHESNQMIRLRSVPSEEGSWNDLLLDLTNVNIGDLSPLLSPKDRFEGLLSGNARLENPGPKMTGTGDFKTQFFRYNEDSIGQLNVRDLTYDNQKDGNLKFNIVNDDSVHSVNANANIYLSGNHTDNLIAVQTKEYPLKFLETFLGDLFSDMQGYATGKLDIGGSFNALNYVGKAHLHDAGLKVKFTQVFYKLKDTDIELKKNELDLGSIKLTDTITKYTATLSGSIYHESWKNMNFDLEAKVDDKPITLLNTTEATNNSFYGHAVGTGSMILVGSDQDMYMTIDAKSSEKDSSHIVIPPAKSRASELADFLVERTHGSALRDTVTATANGKTTFDIDLTTDPHTTIEVILDEVTGDVVKGRGRGSLNIHSATGEPLRLNGNIDIEDGSYLFTFQSFFKRPFQLRKEGTNYIRWNGDPDKATIHFDAQYTAENVSFAPLSSFISDPRVQTLRDNVYVIVEMSGELFKPIFNFKLEFPSSSIATSDPILPYNLAQIENNPNELNKQVTYLIVFNSFAPVGGPGTSGASAANTTSGGFSNAINELAYNTISSLLFNELNRQFGNILAQIFKDDKLKVNLSGSVYNRNLIDPAATNDFRINTAGVSVTLSRALFNDRFVITAGSTLDIPFQNSQTSYDQKFQFLPDVTTEWLINEKGTIRATFFYRENLDFEPGTASSTEGKNKRLGAGLSYRREFDHLGDLFRRRADKGKKNQTPVGTMNPSVGRVNDDQKNQVEGSHQ